MSSWSFDVPGQPPSTNHLYRQVLHRRANGSTYMARTKSAGVENYQLVASTLARRGRPKSWEPAGPVRIDYEFFLKRDSDVDNLLKALNDAIAIGLGLNDRVFLPCVKSKQIGVVDPYVRVTVE